MLDSLQGKVAIVTGAARGLGEIIATALLEAGVKVVVTDVMVEEGKKAAEKMQAKGDVTFMPQDVTVEADWERVCADTIKTYGKLDILVNNAGVERCSLLTETDLETFQFIQKVNVEGTFLGMKHGIKTMAPEGVCESGGSIINLSSIAGVRGFTGLNAYCAAKGAVKLMSQSAAVECGDLKNNIRVNSVNPGLIKTDMGAAILEDYAALGFGANADEVEEVVLQRFYPAGHLGDPKDVSDAVLFLASDGAKWITGSQINCDGGASA